MNLLNALKKLVAYEDVDELEITQEEIDEEKRKLSNNIGLTEWDQQRNVAPLLQLRKTPIVETCNTASPFKMVVISPRVFSDSTKLVDMLKQRKPVIINFETTKREEAERIFNFMSGATYTLDGNIQRVSDNIYVFTSSNIQLDVGVAKNVSEEEV